MPVVVGQEKDGPKGRGTGGGVTLPGDGRRGWEALTALGLVLALIGGIDLGVMWRAFDFGTPTWEFQTITAHFSGMPLVTVGIFALAASAEALGWRKARFGLAALVVAFTLFLVGICVIYALTVPVAIQTTNAEFLGGLRLAVGKTTAFALVYVPAYVWLSLRLVRGSGAPGGRSAA